MDGEKAGMARNTRRIAVIGGAVIDRKYHARRELIMETSNPVEGHRSFGGVARNIAENLARLGASVSFVSLVGDDEPGRSLTANLSLLGVDASGVLVTPERPTAEYVAVLDPRNDLFIGLADMAIFDLLAPERLRSSLPSLASADWVLADCNLPAETLSMLIGLARHEDLRLAINTVSSPKALRLPVELARVGLVFTNLDEASALLARNGAVPGSAAGAAAALVEAGAGQAIVTEGAKGYAVASADGVQVAEAVPARPVDITGAGDAFAAGTLYGVLAGDPVAQAARTGALLAALTIESEMSVHPDLSRALLESQAWRIPT